MKNNVKQKLKERATGSLMLVNDGTWQEQIDNLINADFGQAVGFYRRSRFELNVSLNGVIGIDAVGSYFGEKTLKIKFPKVLQDYLLEKISAYIDSEYSKALVKKNHKKVLDCLDTYKRKLTECVNQIEQLETLKISLVREEMKRSELLGEGYSVVDYKSLNDEIRKLERDYDYYAQSFKSLKPESLVLDGYDNAELKKIRFLKSIQNAILQTFLFNAA